MQLLNSLVATITLLALTSSFSVDAQKDYAKMDAKLALFKTVANPPESPDAYFNLIGRNGKWCLKSRRHHATGHYTLSTSKTCTPELMTPPTGNRVFFRVPAADTEANSDFYLAQYIKGKVQCIRMYRHGATGHKMFFDDCRPDLSYTIRETGNESTPKRLFEFTQRGTGKRRRCMRVTPTGALHIRRCDPLKMSQQVMIVYPRRLGGDGVERDERVDRDDRAAERGERRGPSGSYTQITVASNSVASGRGQYEQSRRQSRSNNDGDDHSDSDSSDGEDDE